MKTIRLTAILSCLILLTAGNFPLSWSGTDALANTDQVVTEIEPNDDPLSAQVIPFPAAGQSVSVQGRVASSDSGGFSEEWETQHPRGKIQDWYVADPDQLGDVGDGPLPIRITLSWQGNADIDAYVGTTVDEGIFYFDGYKNINGGCMISYSNPESWPDPSDSVQGIGLYLQPLGVTLNGEPLLNDGYGRKLMVGIKNYDRPITEYTLTIENGTPAGKAAIFATERHQVDDGGMRTTYYFTEGEPHILLNRYKPSRFPAYLTKVSHPFINFSSYPDPTGKMIRVIVLKAESDDLDSTPPPLTPENTLFDQMVMIPGTISPEPGVYYPGFTVDIPISPVTITSGAVFVGLQWPDAPVNQTGILLGMDDSPAQYLRTFMSTDGGQTWGLPIGEESVTGETVYQNAAIRAVFSYGESKTEGTYSSPGSPKFGRRALRPARAIQTVVPVR